MSAQADDRTEPVWYVRTHGRVWGPYPEKRIGAFIEEGRVSATTMLSASAHGDFRAAGDQTALRRLFGNTEIEPDLALKAPTPAPSPASEPVGAVRPLVVFAALTTLEPAAFEAALAMHGPYEAAGPGLWLVRARVGPAALRNALSRRLRGGDMLMVVEAGLDQAAWFNLNLAEERRLRALWSG